MTSRTEEMFAPVSSTSRRLAPSSLTCRASSSGLPRIRRKTQAPNIHSRRPPSAAREFARGPVSPAVVLRSATLHFPLERPAVDDLDAAVTDTDPARALPAAQLLVHALAGRADQQLVFFLIDATTPCHAPHRLGIGHGQHALRKSGGHRQRCEIFDDVDEHADTLREQRDETPVEL